MKPQPAIAPDPNATPELRSFLLYFLKLGSLGFGGPIALAAHMQRDLVEQRRWISSQDYAEGLAFAQLSPGPLAAQLAMYLGWIRAGALGATLAGIVFILPSFLLVILLSLLYVHYGQLSWIRGTFYGIGACVVAIIVASAYRLVRSTLKKDRLLWILFAALALTTAYEESEIIWLFLLCGFISMAIKAPLRLPQLRFGMSQLTAVGKLVGSMAVPYSTARMGPLFLFFLKAGAFVFGSGLAIVPFLYGGVVQKFHWLTEKQFLDAIAVAMITPGPVVITAAFIGYVVSGFAGALLASLAVFAPPYLIVIVGAPHYRRFAQNRQMKAFVQGVTAAAFGAIVGAAFILGRRSIIDLPTAAIAVLALVLLMLKKVPEPFLIVGAGIAGLLLTNR